MVDRWQDFISDHTSVKAASELQLIQSRVWLPATLSQEMKEQKNSDSLI